MRSPLKIRIILTIDTMDALLELDDGQRSRIIEHARRPPVSLALRRALEAELSNPDHGFNDEPCPLLLMTVNQFDIMP